jgi:uncharacterized protein GlcG (DUF336 family)
MTKNNIQKTLGALLCGATLLFGAPALADDGDSLVTIKVMSPEIAMELAIATMAACRSADYQVAVAVVDRFGGLQAMLRDRYAGMHTPETARRKAWTSVSFRSDTLALEKLIDEGGLSGGIRYISDALMIGGGVPVTAAGSMVGGVGVSGAPGGDIDDGCARKGIEAVADKLEF